MNTRTWQDRGPAPCVHALHGACVNLRVRADKSIAVVWRRSVWWHFGGGVRCDGSASKPISPRTVEEVPDGYERVSPGPIFGAHSGRMVPAPDARTRANREVATLSNAKGACVCCHDDRHRGRRDRRQQDRDHGYSHHQSVVAGRWFPYAIGGVEMTNLGTDGRRSRRPGRPARLCRWLGGAGSPGRVRPGERGTDDDVLVDRSCHLGEPAPPTAG